VVGGAVVVEIMIFIIEAAVYRSLLGLSSKEAFPSALLANAASCLLGVGLAAGLGHWLDEPFEGVRGGLYLLIGALVTLAVEVPIVAAFNRAFPDRGRLLRTAAIANLATYLGESLILLWITTW
jgi:hypothetical protein